MNYELAKKLKDAGFPQIGREEEKPIKLDSIKAVGIRIKNEDESTVYVPTLSELIEACLDTGDDKKMQLNFDKTQCGAWIGNQYEREKFAKGKTMEEAVANLWLALNKP